MQKYPDGLYVKDEKVISVMAHPIINANGTLLGRRSSVLRLVSCSSARRIFVGVVEFYRTESTVAFSREDEEVRSSIWLPVAICLELT